MAARRTTAAEPAPTGPVRVWELKSGFCMTQHHENCKRIFEHPQQHARTECTCACHGDVAA
ncbi:MAG: hypothetical protein QG661_2820 [Actinomycetota bacterium]|nr:hypothetical protein [Actinomycetota bacterium]MDQ5975611.1 hypothetical protein [Actinomycetota bacterium]